MPFLLAAPWKCEGADGSTCCSQCSGQQTLPGTLRPCFEEVVEKSENIAKHGTSRSVKCCSLLLGPSFDQWTCYGFTDLPKRTESDPEAGAPESFKINTSFQTGGAEKKKNEKICLEVVCTTFDSNVKSI